MVYHSISWYILPIFPGLCDLGGQYHLFGAHHGPRDLQRARATVGAGPPRAAGTGTHGHGPHHGEHGTGGNGGMGLFWDMDGNGWKWG